MEDIYAMFCGEINQLSAQRIMYGISRATESNDRVHVLFQSTGGTIGDGVCLHNFFKSCPIDLVLYNVGTISSVGVIAYLGAKTRVAATTATFMIHSTESPAVAMSLHTLEKARVSLQVDESRVLEILKSHISIDPDQWSNLRDNELWFTAQAAFKSGIATIIGDFAPPRGALICTL